MLKAFAKPSQILRNDSASLVKEIVAGVCVVLLSNTKKAKFWQ